MKESWSRGDKIAAWTLGIAVTAIAASFFIPEVRQFFHLEKPPQIAQAETKPQSSSQSSPAIQTEQANPEPPKPTSTKPKKIPKPTQKTTTHVTGNENVAGNNVSGDHNVTGNKNQTGPTAVAPNGIAIAGGTVIQPTVNNFGPPPLPTPTVTICVTHPPAVESSMQNVITFKTDVEIMEPWYALFFDGPVGDGSVEMTPHSFGYTHSRADKLEHPENTFLFRNTSVDFGPPRWLPNNAVKVTVPSKAPVNLVTLMSGSGENGRDEKFVFSCE